MAVFDLYSKRMKRQRGEVHDIYTYNSLPQALRVQVVHILRDTLGVGDNEPSDGPTKAYEAIVDLLCREYGVFTLDAANFVARYRNYAAELSTFILQETDVERVLDAIEVSFRVINRFTRNYNYLWRNNADAIADSALEELNERFSEHGIGFRIEKDHITRIDSELLHAEVVKPALTLLNEPRFSGAQDEFVSAHEHYRSTRYKEALNDALKSLESVMKTICKTRGWEHKPTATATELIEVCFTHGLIPPFWQGHFSSLRSMLQSSTPTGRNKLSAHGQGTEIRTVPQHIAGYILHMTAATIVFLAAADSSLT